MLWAWIALAVVALVIWLIERGVAFTDAMVRSSHPGGRTPMKRDDH